MNLYNANWFRRLTNILIENSEIPQWQLDYEPKELTEEDIHDLRLRLIPILEPHHYIPIVKVHGFEQINNTREKDPRYRIIIPEIVKLIKNALHYHSHDFKNTLDGKETLLTDNMHHLNLIVSINKYRVEGKPFIGKDGIEWKEFRIITAQREPYYYRNAANIAHWVIPDTPKVANALPKEVSNLIDKIKVIYQSILELNNITANKKLKAKNVNQIQDQPDTKKVFVAPKDRPAPTPDEMELKELELMLYSIESIKRRIAHIKATVNPQHRAAIDQTMDDKANKKMFNDLIKIARDNDIKKGGRFKPEAFKDKLEECVFL